MRKHAMIVKEHYGQTKISLELKVEPSEKAKLEKLLSERRKTKAR